MSIAGIIVLALIVACSIVAIFVAEEPLDTVVEVEAALNSLGMRPLASKVISKDKGRYDIVSQGRERPQKPIARQVSTPVAMKGHRAVRES